MKKGTLTERGDKTDEAVYSAPPWAILAAGAAIQILTGLPAAWGVFQQPVMDEFSLTEDGAGYAFGILIAAFGVGCVIGGFCRIKKARAVRRCGAPACSAAGSLRRPSCPGKWCSVLGSVQHSGGAGHGRFSTRPSSPAPRMVRRAQGTCTGVIGGAVGLSGAFLTGFVRTALKGFGPVQGIRGAFWALGALTLPVCLVGSALLTDPPTAKQKPEEQAGERAPRPSTLPRCRCSEQNSTGSAPGRSAVPPRRCCCSAHHLKAGHGAGPGRGRCPVECGAGQRGQRGGPLADAPAQTGSAAAPLT